VAVVGAFLMFFGFCFVAVTMLMLVMRGSDQRLLRRLRRAARPTIGELSHAATLPRWVLITGRTVAGPEGILTTPAFGTACIWYEMAVTSDDGSDTRTCYVDQRAGGQAASVTDGTGSAQFDLRLAFKVSSHHRIDRYQREECQLRRDGAPPDGSGLAVLERTGLLPRSVYPRFGSRRVSLVEHTIGADVELSVFARPRHLRSGVLLRPWRGAVSAGSPPDWIARLEDGVGTAAWASRRLAVVGLVLGALGVALIWVGA
jgi:hypothetical protein